MTDKQEREAFHWKTHTPNLLKEVLANPSCHILEKPLQIFARTLFAVADRAAELNDSILNDLMVRLTLYDVADPESPNYDREVVEQVRQARASLQPQGVDEQAQPASDEVDKHRQPDYDSRPDGSGLDDGPKLPLSVVMATKRPMIVAAYKEGLSARACARVFGVSHDTAASIVKSVSQHSKGEDAGPKRPEAMGSKLSAEHIAKGMAYFDYHDNGLETLVSVSGDEYCRTRWKRYLPGAKAAIQAMTTGKGDANG